MYGTISPHCLMMSVKDVSLSSSYMPQQSLRRWLEGSSFLFTFLIFLIVLRFPLRKTFGIILNAAFMTQALACQQPVSLRWGVALCTSVSVVVHREIPPDLRKW